jgi:YVTN family beta-propeller protein
MKRTSDWLWLRVVYPVFLLLMALPAIPAQAQTFAYVADPHTSTVSVIDTASNKLVATIADGVYPWGLAITPDGSRVYVADTVSNSAVVIDTASNKVVATVAVGNNPIGAAVTPDGSRAYVANAFANSVSVIDTADNIVVATITVGDGPYGLAFTPDGSRAYVANSQSSAFPNPGTVSVIDTASNTVTGTIIVGVNPLGVAITPDGRRAYVTNGGDFTVSVIDTANNTVTATVAVGAIPFWLAITPDGTRAYVANGGDGTVSVIDTGNNTVVATVATGILNGPFGVAITPDGSRVYVTNSSGDTVSVIDTASNKVVATVKLAAGSGPFGVAITPAFGTRTSLKSSLNPSIYGQKVTFTAIVKSSGPIPPTGRVKFTWGDTIGSAALNSHGVATITRSNLNADPYPLVAVYSGDAHNLSSKSAVLNQVIVETTSAATITSSQNPSTHGQPVTLTATITSPTVMPTGPVTFSAGKMVLGTAQLGGGKAKFTTSTLEVGSTTITATYHGDSNIAKSSASVIQNVK